MLRCTFLANCGLHLEYAGESLLIDAPNGLRTAFDGVPFEEGERIIAGLPPYHELRGLLFTHKHSDHYDRSRVRAAAASRPNLTVFAPNGITSISGSFDVGIFRVFYFSVPHSGEEFANVFHRVLLVQAGSHRLYITGDAQWDDDLHRTILCDYKVNAAFWNPNFVNHEQGRELLQLVPQNYIYHMPVTAEDVFGIGRKARSTFAKFTENLKNTKLIDIYPTCIEL